MSPEELAAGIDALAKEKAKGDGYASRKFILVSVITVVVESLASVGWLALDKMTADQWSTFNMWFLPFMFGLYGFANVAEKFALKPPVK